MQVICGLNPLIKHLGYIYAKIQEIFMLDYVPFQPIKDNAALKPMKGHFRGLV